MIVRLVYHDVAEVSDQPAIPVHLGVHPLAPRRLTLGLLADPHQCRADLGKTRPSAASSFTSSIATLSGQFYG